MCNPKFFFVTQFFLNFKRAPLPCTTKNKGPSYTLNYIINWEMSQDKKRLNPGKSHVLASAVSGFIELLTFHPLDTITKRLINHHGTLTNLKKIIFPCSNPTLTHTYLSRYMSLYPGFQYAILYKVSQRTYQFGGHPFVSAYLFDHHLESFKLIFGEKNSNLGTLLLSSTNLIDLIPIHSRNPCHRRRFNRCR